MIALRGVAQTSLRQEDVAEIGVRVRKVRIDGQRAFKLRHCLGLLALRQQDIADIHMGLDQVRIERERLLKMGNRFIRPAQSAERVGQIVVRGDEIGLERQGAPEMRYRIVEPAAAREHVGEIAMRFGARPERDDALVGRNRLGQRAGLQQCFAEIAVGIDVVPLETDRLAILVTASSSRPRD